MSSATSLVRAVLARAEREGVSARALLGPAALDPAVVADRDARVPTPAYLQVFAAAAERSRDDAFGASVAELLDASAFGLLGFVVASCATLRDAFERFCRYSRLLCDELRVDVVDRGAEVAIVYELDCTPRVSALFEMALTHLVRTSHRGTSRRFVPRRVTFRHRSASRALRERLGAPVELGAPEDAVVCAAADLTLPLRGHQPVLLDILDAQAARALEALPHDDDLLSRARATIRKLLPRGEPSLETVARQLGIGSRTLQRRLRDQSLTFRGVVDDVRRDCAIAQLAHPDTSVAEIAFALGFSTPSAFHHAFRRWTGHSPRRRG